MIADTLILFDIDGTLLFSNKVDSQCFADTFYERYAKQFPSIDWTYFPHVTDHTIFREAYKEIHSDYPSLDEIETFTRQFVASIQKARIKKPDAFQMVPGAKSLFNDLQDNSTALGIGTGGWQAPATIKLKHVDLYHDELILSAADEKDTREHIVQEAIDRCQKKFGERQRIVYVGDAAWDARTCRNMEIPMIGLRRKGDHGALKELGVSHVLSDYKDKSAFIEAVKTARVPN